MSKTLIVSYTPRVDSNTQKLVDTYLETMPEGASVEYLNLLDKPAPVHTRESVAAMLKRNFAGMSLNDSESQSVVIADQFTQQVLDSDFIVFAFPMYNFTVPAAVKAWVDLIVQNGRTFTVTEEGEYAGLCQGKSALILMTSGGDFSTEPNKSMNFATPYMQSCLGFLGIHSTAISAFGLNQYEHRAAEILAQAQHDIRLFSHSKNAETS